MPYQLVYSSQATQPMAVADLEKILVDARTGNELRDVTGVLIYVDGVFLQILEGAKDTVLDLLKSIALDTRHNSLKVFSQLEVEEAAFHSWRMAYLNATPEQLSAWAGLAGTATMDEIFADIDQHPQRVAGVARGILQALRD
jgi:hypothetical protein